MPKARARTAMALPMRPKPTMPMVLPATSPCTRAATKKLAPALACERRDGFAHADLVLEDAEHHIFGDRDFMLVDDADGGGRRQRAKRDAVDAGA